MTLEIGLLFLILGVMVTLFLTEKLPVDLTAFAGLSVLLLVGFIGPGQAFRGFSSPAVMTMFSMFILGTALLETGVADRVGGFAYKIVGGGEVPLIVALMLITGLLSAFMPNIAAVAVMMPAVGSIARRADIAPSRLFMPLSFGAVLGGMTTLVGTAPNILTSPMLEDAGLAAFSLFDFTLLGGALLLAGTLYMITIGRRMLPNVRRATASSEAKKLAGVYGLGDRLFSLRVRSGSQFIGRSLEETRFSTVSGFEVLAVVRGEETLYVPNRKIRLQADDRLLINGKRNRLENLQQLQGLEIHATEAQALPGIVPGAIGIRAAIVEGSPWIGSSLQDLGFRDRFGLSVVALGRGDDWTTEQVGREPLRAGDVLIALGPEDQAEAFLTATEVRVEARGYEAMEPLLARLFVVGLPESSPLVGVTLRESRLAERVGLVIGGILRGDKTMLAPSPEERLLAGDRLLVTGEPWRLLALLELPGLQIEFDTGEPIPESEHIGLIEASIPARSALAGKTLHELEFRKKYGVQVLSIWFEGQPHHEDLAGHRLRVGDALLLQGPWKEIEGLALDEDVVLLSANLQKPKRTKKAAFAVFGLLAMVGMVVTGYQPIHVAAFIAASFTLLTGAIKMDEAYRAIEWRTIFLVASLLPLGEAMQTTGAADLMASTVTDLAGPYGPYVVLAALAILSSLLSQSLDGAPAVVLLAPVAFRVATSLGISPYPIIMGVGLAASAAFMTPFSHKAHLLVTGAGCYRSMDFVKIGTPLTILILGLIVLLVPLAFPF